MGWTTLINAAVPADEAAFARAQMNEIVDVDVGFLLELGADARLAEIYRRQGDTAAVEHIHQQLNETGAIGLKVMAPASSGDDRRDS